MFSVNKFMNMILIHRNSADNGGEGLLRFALAGEPAAEIVLNGLCKNGKIKKRMMLGLSAATDAGKTFYAVPDEWEIAPLKSRHGIRIPERSLYKAKSDVIRYKDNIAVPSEYLHGTGHKDCIKKWFAVSNGRYATYINPHFLDRILDGVEADIIAVNADSGLLGQGEKIRLTNEGEVAGFCRSYSDSAEYTFISHRWPHHLFIKADVLDRVLVDGTLPLSFPALSGICRSKDLILRAVKLGGIVLDLETEDGLLSFSDTVLSDIQDSTVDSRYSNKIPEDAKLIGNVLLGRNIQIGPKAVIIGPTIIGNDVSIGEGVVINSSIIGPNVCVRENQVVQRRIIRETQTNCDRTINLKSGGNLLRDSHGPFRTWPRLSYARCLKRLADFIAAAVVLILFAPVLVLVALAIKLTSPGPVFYKDRRQGLHGKEFNCLKFRTMIMGADKIQDILRIVSQVDGPQFKINDDPRINTVGWFLRETYIDEIPQFINVLLGHMSIVGPRPSPKSENTLCPFWRDARLSVRPGITGLWQIYRTRQPMKDFQEWIYYDIEYVRNLSLRMDLSICWKTAMKLLGNFIDQF